MERSKDSTGRKKRYCGKIVDVSVQSGGPLHTGGPPSREPVVLAAGRLQHLDKVLIFDHRREL